MPYTSQLLSSKAEAFNIETTSRLKGINYTSSEIIDETKLYNELNNRLNSLEKSLTVNRSELMSIEQLIDKFRFELDIKEEILLRINWLHILYEIKEAVESNSIETIDKAERFRAKIASVQVCPMKNELVSKLDSLKEKLPQEQSEETKLSAAEQLMEIAIKEVGDDFINLGKEGRNFVISKVMTESSADAIVNKVKELTISIEQDVNDLNLLNEPTELVRSLESLSFISSFTELPAERKLNIAERLLEGNKWSGLASLNRMITLLDRRLTIEERERNEAKNVIQLNEGKLSFTLNLNNISSVAIK